VCACSYAPTPDAQQHPHPSFPPFHPAFLPPSLFLSSQPTPIVSPPPPSALPTQHSTRSSLTHGQDEAARRGRVLESQMSMQIPAAIDFGCPYNPIEVQFPSADVILPSDESSAAYRVRSRTQQREDSSGDKRGLARLQLHLLI